MKTSITRLMIKQHSTIHKKLRNFENTPDRQIKRLRQNFGDFKWNLQKHMFNEETNIFAVIDHKNKIEVTQIKDLLEDHREITSEVEKIVEDLLINKKPDVKFLFERLTIHEQKEVTGLYPLLDRKLSPEQKKEVIAYSEEIKIV